MHPCLRIPEILTWICAFLPKRDLASLALTCRQLKEIALDSLWEELPRLLPFVQLLPQDTWSPGPRRLGYTSGWICTRRKPVTVVTPKRDISPSDWLPVIPYATRVHQLTITGKDRFDTFLESILPSFTETSVFPNLRKLFISHPLDPYIKFLKVTLSPKLTHLTLDLEGSAEAPALLPQLGVICPALIALTFRGLGIDEPCCDNISQSVCSLDKLQIVDVPMLNAKALRHLSHLPNFTDLTIWPGIHLDMANIIPNASHFAGFETLRVFAMGYHFACSVKNLTSILNVMETSVMDSLFVDPERGSLNEWEDYFKVVAQRTSKATSLKLRVNAYINPSNDPNEERFIDCTVLRPLLEARNLVSLCFYGSSYGGIHLTDSFIRELAKESPHLTDLYVYEYYTNNNHPPAALTLKSYGYLLRYCPKIRNIQLSVDPNAKLIMDDLDEGDYERHSGGLTLHHHVTLPKASRARSPTRVAKFLLPYFSDPVRDLKDINLGSVESNCALRRLVEAMAHGPEKKIVTS